MKNSRIERVVTCDYYYLGHFCWALLDRYYLALL